MCVVTDCDIEQSHFEEICLADNSIVEQTETKGQSTDSHTKQLERDTVSNVDSIKDKEAQAH